MKMENLLGVVMCGGESFRMGIDKSRIQYYDEEQRYYLYNILKNICASVVLSIRSPQVSEIKSGYNFIIDEEEYSDAGPMAGLVSVHHAMPDKNILVVGCDYPLLTLLDLKSFVSEIEEGDNAAAFFNQSTNFYEPVLAYYSVAALKDLATRLSNNQNSLQQYLRTSQARKFVNYDSLTLRSVDNREEMQEAMEQIKTNSRNV